MKKKKYAVNPKIIDEAITNANDSSRAIFLIFLATKPCYIKLASLIKECRISNLPFLVIDVGQHYETELISAMNEFNYSESVAVNFAIQGALYDRWATLGRSLYELSCELKRRGLKVPAIPVVSGDTSTAGAVPHLWYLITGIRSVHVEAGLRSMGPEIPNGWESLQNLAAQRSMSWYTRFDTPFPEGAETRVASILSQLWLAPTERNKRILIKDGYPENRIRVVGSLSSDAALIGEKIFDESNCNSIPWPKGKRWIRVDIHRRENTTPQRLLALFDGLCRANAAGHQLLLVLGRMAEQAVNLYNLGKNVEQLRRCGIPVQRVWPSYSCIIQFLKSPDCAGIYTDSGGLQEECCILGIPCLTCRDSTDRPETVLEAKSNLLAPLVNGSFVKDAVDQSVAHWNCNQLSPSNIYGYDVGKRIVNELLTFDIWLPAVGSSVLFDKSLSLKPDAFG